MHVLLFPTAVLTNSRIDDEQTGKFMISNMKHPPSVDGSSWGYFLQLMGKVLSELISMRYPITENFIFLFTEFSNCLN